MSNINSYADNMADLTKNVSDVLSIVEGINEAMSGDDAEVKVTENITLPSFSNVVKRVERAENTISKFTQGKGIIETDDGTYRKVKVSTISKPPRSILLNNSTSSFDINANWFFESLQYPRCVIKLDLKGQIDDSSDRVYVTRIIIDSTQITSAGTGTTLDFYYQYIDGKGLTYSALIGVLEKYKIEYREDRDEIKLPLTYEKYKGEFGVEDIKLLKDENGVSRQWYYLNTINYASVDTNGIETSNSHVLNVNDYLRYENSLYKIIDISQSQKRVRLEYAVGYEAVGIGNIFELYNEPFSEKVIEVGIGIDEINIVYVKGVNEEYNLVSRDWSTPISFYTNLLVFAEDNVTTFYEYYTQNVSDFGKQWIAQAKEKQIYSYHGLVPYAPVLNLADLKVVQINTQLDTTLDTETYNELTSEIASVKSNIAALRNTISSNKDLMIQSSSSDERNNIQNLINSDTESLNSFTTQYNSLVEELNTLLNESGAIDYTPKYHIRGFFGIPNPRYIDEQKKLGEQNVIAFDIKYRYLHTDDTGVKLDTYEYTDANSGLQAGVFTDWNMITSSTLSKMYDEKTGTYYWYNEPSADGSVININQIDIPIQSGEKVEIKVRSISEAGYPYNPLKSDWSDSIIVPFPENLTSDNSVTTILDSVKNDMTAVVLQETMSAAGVYTHLADSDSTYKHKATNISYTDSVTDENKKTTLTEMSVQDKMDAIVNKLSEIEKTIVTTIQKSVYDTNSSLIAEFIDMKRLLGYTDIPTDASMNAIVGNPPVLDETNKNRTFSDVIESNSTILKQIIDVLGINTNPENTDPAPALLSAFHEGLTLEDEILGYTKTVKTNKKK